MYQIYSEITIIILRCARKMIGTKDTFVRMCFLYQNSCLDILFLEKLISIIDLQHNRKNTCLKSTFKKWIMKNKSPEVTFVIFVTFAFNGRPNC